MRHSNLAHPSRHANLPACFLGLAVGLLLACLPGILRHPTGLLSAFLPANAVLLGMLLRWPELAQRTSWLIGLGVFVLADMLTGSSLLTALWLSGAKLCGVACGWWLLQRLDAPRLYLRRQSSVPHLLAGCSIASAAAALAGAGAGPYLFATGWIQTALLWFSTELMNYLLVLPVLLSIPEYRPRRWLAQLRENASLALLLPLLCVIGTEYAAITLGGPGALAFTVPSLLWCALTYSLFTTTVLSLLVCCWKITSISLGLMDFTPGDLDVAVSLRLGLALLSIGPLAVASTLTARTEQLQRLKRSASHDSLTDVLARGAFMDQGRRILERLQCDGKPTAVLMLDLDYFKQVNDRHGHPAGDALLRAFARTVGGILRPQDLLGRVGGEEFAVLLQGVRPAAAEQIAARICAAVRAQRLALRAGPVLRVTVSIGVAWNDGSPQTLEELLQHADTALYQAKACGRDGWQRAVAGAQGPALAIPA